MNGRVEFLDFNCCQSSERNGLRFLLPSSLVPSICLFKPAPKTEGRLAGPRREGDRGNEGGEGEQM